MDINKIRELSYKLIEDFAPEVADLGYELSRGMSLSSLEPRLKPLEGSPDPIPDDLLEKIRNEIVPKNYNGLPVNVQYFGKVSARKKLIQP